MSEAGLFLRILKHIFKLSSTNLKQTYQLHMIVPALYFQQC